MVKLGWVIQSSQRGRTHSTKSCFSIKSNPGEPFGLRLCRRPALCNPGRLFIRRIFSKPSPSSTVFNLQPALRRILARSRCSPALGASGSGRLPAADIHSKEKERGSSSLPPSLTLPFPVCVVFCSLRPHVFALIWYRAYVASLKMPIW